MLIGGNDITKINQVDNQDQYKEANAFAEIVSLYDLNQNLSSMSFLNNKNNNITKMSYK